MSVNLENECKVSTSDSDCWGVFEGEDENSDHGGAGLDESPPLLSLPHCFSYSCLFGFPNKQANRNLGETLLEMLLLCTPRSCFLNADLKPLSSEKHTEHMIVLKAWGL